MELLTPEVTTTETQQILRPIGFYSSHLRALLPKEIFEPCHRRLYWLAGYGLSGLAALFFIAHYQLAWPFKLLLALVVGTAWGALGFFAHELMHGSVVKSRSVQNILGFFCFMPFLISPTFWRFWHNQLHHGKTQSLISDPDAFPTLRIFKASKFMQFMYPYTPGSGHKRSYMYFFFWFSFHVFVAQTYLRFRNSIFETMNHRRVTIEMGLQIIIWSTVLYLTGPANLFWTFVIPLFIQNYFIMSYIATNHNLSPLTKINDPLVNSLTVKNLPILEWFHLNFGYHVEHHIYPTINGLHIKKVHAVLKKEFPQDFKCMPKFSAMVRLYKTGRIYKNSKTLINPETGVTTPTY